jgi:hypothetical protein
MSRWLAFLLMEEGAAPEQDTARFTEAHSDASAAAYETTLEVR